MDKCFFAHPFGMEVKNSKDIRRRMWHLWFSARVRPSRKLLFGSKKWSGPDCVEFSAAMPFWRHVAEVAWWRTLSTCVNINFPRKAFVQKLSWVVKQVVLPRVQVAMPRRSPDQGVHSSQMHPETWETWNTHIPSRSITFNWLLTMLAGSLNSSSVFIRASWSAEIRDICQLPFLSKYPEFWEIWEARGVEVKGLGESDSLLFLYILRGQRVAWAAKALLGEIALEAWWTPRQSSLHSAFGDVAATVFQWKSDIVWQKTWTNMAKMTAKQTKLCEICLHLLWKIFDLKKNI
jgi:hypothetical protein